MNTKKVYIAVKNATPSGTVFIGTRVKYVITEGCNVSDSLATGIGDQMALRRSVFAPSVLTLQSVTVVL